MSDKKILVIGAGYAGESIAWKYLAREELQEKCILLEADLAAMKADAKRYRWLRQNITHYNPDKQSGPVLSGARIWYHASDNVEYPIDAAIDAAMKEKP